MFRNFWLSWQWVETKWRWLATQDHVKLAYCRRITLWSLVSGPPDQSTWMFRRHRVWSRNGREGCSGLLYLRHWKEKLIVRGEFQKTNLKEKIYQLGRAQIIFRRIYYSSWLICAQDLVDFSVRLIFSKFSTHNQFLFPKFSVSPPPLSASSSL